MIMRMMRLTVHLNGTNENPWHKYGLTQNPFPQIAEYRYSAACLQMQALDGEPIKSLYDIHQRLRGWSEEFIELCCDAYIPGESVSFCTTFEEK